jgi:flavin reductase (DIM6/NTAB) family NADH-FMN oxidoreductase RutF
MLGAENLGLAKKMAEDQTKRFADSDWEFSEFGLPVFREATAVLFVKVREFHRVEQNAVFISEVLSGKLGTLDKGLLYFQRSYFNPADTAL